jgi:GNAT superfamily N-acetyltransferase
MPAQSIPKIVLADQVGTMRVGEADELGVGAADITRFIATNWPRRVAISQPEFYEWQFRASPENDGRDHSIVLADDSGEIHGFMGLNRRRFWLGRRKLAGAELTTWVISPAAQGLGLSLMMLELLQRRYDVLLGTGIGDAALPLYLRTGFRYLRYLPRYVRVLHPEAVAAISAMSTLGKRLIRQYSASPRTSFESRRLQLEDTTAAIERLRDEFNGFDRDAATLTWRYLRHPEFRYEAYLVRSAEGTLVVILREDATAALKIVHVIDVFGDLRELSAAIQFIEDFCRERNADCADFFCASDRLGHVFRYSGWFSTVDDPWIQIPHLFHPVEMWSPPTTSVIMWSGVNPCALLEQARLYVTKGDCDLDRPTMEYIQNKPKR